jgi:predicted nucleotide-binding protein
MLTLWSPLTNHGSPELFFLTRVAGRPHGQCFRFTGSDLSTYSLAQSGDGIGNVLAERCEDAEDWVHADKDHLFAIWTGRQDRLELRVATVIDRSDLQSPFSESSLGHWFYLLSGERTVLSALTAQEVGWRVVTGYSRPEVIDSMADPKKVFVVYGRNDRIKRAMFAFLRSIGLQPLEWSVVIDETGKGAPTIDEILKTGFDLATAAVVVLTGDDEARIRPDFLSDHDSQTEREYTPQPRQNVLYEAGMAMGRYPDQTVLVEIPPLRPFSDIGGIHTVRMDNSIAQRQSLANRLKRAGCAVELIGTSWHTEGDFSPAAQRTSSQ